MAHVTFTMTLGIDLPSISLPAGQARGIAIDNPSGSWLTLYPTYDLIPPYTNGWARTFDNAVASATVRFTDGPAGLVSTLAGDRPTVTLYDYAIAGSGGAPSPGAPFISRDTQPEIETLNIVLNPTNIADVSVTTILGGSTTTRIRVHNAFFAVSVSNRLHHHVNGILARNILGAPIIAQASLGPGNESQAILFPNAFDLSLGEEIRASAFIGDAVVGDAESVEWYIQYSVV